MGNGEYKGNRMLNFILGSVFVSLLGLTGYLVNDMFFSENILFGTKAIASQVYENKKKQMSQLEKQVLQEHRSVYGSSAIFNIDEIEDMVRSKVDAGSVDKSDLGKIIFNVFRNSGYITINDDCNSLASGLAMLYKRFGIEPKIMTLNNHVFLCFDDQGKKVYVDPTNGQGFDTDYYKKRTQGVQEHDLDTLLSFIYADKAKILLDKFDIHQTLEYCKKALEINPMCALAQMRLASCYAFQRNFEKAVVEQKKAIELNPYYSTFYNNLGSFYYVMGQYEDAAIAFKKALYFSRFDFIEDSLPKIKSSIDLLLSDCDVEDLIYLPDKVGDRNLFDKYVSIVEDLGLVYEVDFRGDKKAYMGISLGDLVYEDFVMVFESANVSGQLKITDFRLAKRAGDGEYYYADGDKRVLIKSGTLFYIPLEKDF